MKKICLVVQRYGLEVNGGAELQCRQFAERLVNKFEVTVLTTKAVDYMTWGDYYQKDEEDINGVHIIRFSVKKERNIRRFNEINKKFLDGKIKTEEQEKQWIEEQGPYVPGLIKYLKENKEYYDAFLFFTYLYYTTVIGIQFVSQKAILIPEAHDEPFLKMESYRQLFYEPKAIFYNTEEERRLVERKMQGLIAKNDIGGVGVEIPKQIEAEVFKEKYKLDNYIIYVGRIDKGKNCDILFDFFRNYKKRNPGNLKLVLMGKSVIEVPCHQDIVNLGFVSDQDKFNGIAGARLLVLPSEFESLSMVVLEAFALKIPVLVNGKCEVLKGHCIKSNGGLFYQGYLEFEGCLNYMLSHSEECKIMGENGKVYVDENYRWDIIINRLEQLIDYVAKGEQK